MSCGRLVVAVFRSCGLAAHAMVVICFCSRALHDNHVQNIVRSPAGLEVVATEKDWDDLSSAETKAATVLGYTPIGWDNDHDEW